mmetsp:Transcript_68264/g.154449  ORF Transcript_68264/g.154449 Transcript_68264/m.154449 type:complete len:277 (-) Transcript_68264:250-1080(-)
MTGDPETHGEISLSLDPEDSTTNTAETKGGNPPPPRVNRVRSVRRSKNGGSPGSSIVVEPEVQAPAPPAPPADPVTARSPPPPRPLPPKSPAARKRPMIKAVSSPEFKDPAPSGAPSRSPRSKTPLQVRKEAAMAAAAETEPTKPLGEKQGQSLSAPLFIKKIFGVPAKSTPEAKPMTSVSTNQLEAFEDGSEALTGDWMKDKAAFTASQRRLELKIRTRKLVEKSKEKREERTMDAGTPRAMGRLKANSENTYQETGENAEARLTSTESGRLASS